MKTITVINGATLTDIAIQYYGCLEGFIQLLTDNPFITALDQIVRPGTKLQVQDTVPVFNQQNVAIVAEFALQGYEVSTGYKSPIPAGPYVVADDGQAILINGQGILITPAVTPIVTDNNEPILTDEGLSISTHP